MVCHPPAKFSDPRHCCRGHRMVLVNHVISQGNVIEESCDFMG